jgi:hypothetical protein
VQSSLRSKKIVINASAAKYGGAKTIVESFISWVGVHDKRNKFVLVAPFCPGNLPDNVSYQHKETSGLGTLFFSVIGVLLYCLKHKADICLSFNNVNLILPICKRITYFHQPKVFTDNGMRFRIMALMVKLIHGSAFVFQSPLIEQRFIDKFSDGFKMQIHWPGLGHSVDPNSDVYPLDKKQNEYVMLWPVTDPSASHKNLKWMQQHDEWFVENNVRILMTSSKATDCKSIESIGLLSREQLFSLYSQVDAVLMVSLEETFCLPIYEAASLNSKVLVLNRPYIETVQTWKGLPSNIILFDSKSTLIQGMHNKKCKLDVDADYFEPDWKIYQ